MQLYIDWLKNYFSEKSTLPDNFEQINYFEAGMINSLEIINLIESIESSFNLKFNESHFQQRRFATIYGLAKIMEEIKKEQSV